MSSAKFQLPDFLVADMYKQSIVLIQEEEPVTKTAKEPVPKPEKQPAVKKPAKEEKPAIVTPAPVKWYLGDNKKNITLLVNEKEAAYLEDASLQFLSSILGACKLNLGDVAIVNCSRDTVEYTQLKEQLSPRFLLLFDVTAKQVQLPFTVPFYQVQTYDNCQFLLAPSLELMLGDGQAAKLEKSKLWLSLKKMFVIT